MLETNLSNSLLSSAVIAVIVVIVSGYAVSYNMDVGTVSDIAFTSILDVVYATHFELSLILVDSISESDNSSLELDGATGITTFKSDTNIYAVVASNVDNGVQILNVTNPTNIVATDIITDNSTNLRLDGARGITTFELSTGTYAAVASDSTVDNGVQILNVTDPTNIVATDSISESDNSSLELDGATGITTFKSDTDTYVAVTAKRDHGVQILKVTDPTNIVATDNISNGVGGSKLRGASGIATFQSNNSIYVVVAALEDESVQIINVTDPERIIATGNIKDDADLILRGAVGITTFKSDTDTYAAVAVRYEDGVQILNVTDPTNIVAAGNVTDGGDLELNGAYGITTFELIGHTYAAVATRNSDGVQIIDVTDPTSITAVGNIPNMSNPEGITTFQSDTDTYVAVADYGDDIVKIIKLETTLSTSTMTPPVILLRGGAVIDLTVGGTYTELGADCEDDADGDKDATVSGHTVNTSTAGEYIVRYNCTDSDGNVADEVTRTVNVAAVVDNATPVILLRGGAVIDLTVGGTYTELGADCEDDADGDKDATVSGHTVNTSTAGEYIVRYNCTDSDGNVADEVTRTVNVAAVVDNATPVILLRGGAVIDLTVGGTYTELGADCEDDADGDKDATVSGHTVNTSTAGEYIVRYNCTDSDGNVADEVTRTVNVAAVVDNAIPVISLEGDPVIDLTVGDTYTEEGAICKDDVDDNKAAIVGGAVVDTSTVGEYIVTYNCTDSDGNTADEVTRTVNVAADIDPPRIVINGPNPVSVIVNGTYNEFGARCIDNVDLEKLATADSSAVDETTIDIYTVYYNCTDAALNAAQPATRTVNVVETLDIDRSSKKRSNSQNNLVADSDIVIDGQNYSISSGITTIETRDIMTGQTVDITLAAYTATDITHFTAYFNLQGSDVLYSNSDTYVRYVRGEVEITDPHGFISDASITITEDGEQSKKKIVDMAIEFDGEMGLTNMVLYMWNEDRRSTFIRILDAIDVTADAETRQNSASTTGSSTSARVTPEPDVSDDNRSDGGGSQSNINSGIAVIGGDNDDDDDAQTLSLIRMWSGFASESITDAELLESMGLDNYPTVHIPDWVMTELGALVSNSDVTVEEFRTALVYMLEMLTA